MKKILVSSLVATALFSPVAGINDGTIVKAAEEKERDDYTFAQVYFDMRHYIIDTTKKSLRAGTEEFNTDILQNDAENLESLIEGAPNEELYNAYIAEYTHRLQTAAAESDDQQIVPLGDPMKPIYSMTLGQMKVQIFLEELAESLKSEGSMSSASLMATASSSNTLSLAKGREYARKYYDDYNSGYPRFSSDCTNFVSQILQYSGRRFVNAYMFGGRGLYDNKKAWFVRRDPNGITFTHSKSWSVVSDQFAHLNLTQSTYSSTSKTNIINKARAGDVVQFKKKGADRYKHGMWVYAKEDGTLKLSGHTNARLKYDFKKIHTYQKFRVISMNME